MICPKWCGITAKPAWSIMPGTAIPKAWPPWLSRTRLIPPTSRPVTPSIGSSLSRRFIVASFSLLLMSSEGYPVVISDVTQIIERLQQGDPRAGEELLPLVYGELRKLAAHKMAQEAPGHTLQPTALVHEAWLRLAAGKDSQWDGRAHFFAAAGEAMRRILIDNARRKRAARHGGGHQRLDINDVQVAASEKEDELLAINDAL